MPGDAGRNGGGEHLKTCGQCKHFERIGKPPHIYWTNCGHPAHPWAGLSERRMMDPSDSIAERCPRFAERKENETK